jgi:hypothetical protein
MRNIPHKITGDDLTADEFNDIPTEEENLITSTGQTLTAGDLYQIAKAVAMYAAVGDFYVDSGSANDYILTAVSPLQAPTQYMDGFRVRFRIGHTNTGSATINVNSLGIKNIVKEDGITPLGAGDLVLGEHGELIFNANINAFELYSHKYQDNVFTTGDWCWTIKNAPPTGWIMFAAGNYGDYYIGDALSGANVRANADCEQLFKMHWNNMWNGSCPVLPGGRGVSAQADWDAHKKIGLLPNAWKVFATAVPNGYDLGTSAGNEKLQLSINNVPAHTHTAQATVGSSTGIQGGSGFSLTEVQSGSTGEGVAIDMRQKTLYMNIMMKL